MKTFEHVIKDAQGIHARPAGLLVKEIKKHESTVMVAKNGKAVEGRKLMALMGLGIKCGETVTITVEGPDEETAASALETFFTENL